MNKPLRTSIYIRRADEDMFHKISKLPNGFGRFVADMMNQHGPEYIAIKAKEQVKELNKLTEG